MGILVFRSQLSRLFSGVRIGINCQVVGRIDKDIFLLTWSFLRNNMTRGLTT